MAIFMNVDSRRILRDKKTLCFQENFAQADVDRSPEERFAL